MRIALALVVTLSGLGCGQEASPPPPTPPGLPSPSPPPGSPLGNTQVQVDGRNVWPPTGPGCAELAACCAAAGSSDVGMFCQMSVATLPLNCVAALGSVRTYLGERGMAVPPACQVGAGAQVGPGWVELTLPQVAGWQRAPGEDHGPEQGFIVEYNIHGQIAATVYVYRGGVANIQRQPAVLGAQVQTALAGMQQAQQMGRYDAVRELGPVSSTTIGSTPDAPVAAHQRVMITREGTERLSETYVTTHRGFFFKLRISLFVDQSAATDASLRALLDQLGAAIHE